MARLCPALLLCLAVLAGGCASRPSEHAAALPNPATAARAAAFPTPRRPLAVPADDVFHAQPDAAELAATPAGTVLRYRPITARAYYVFGVDARAWQIAYVTRGTRARPQADVATILVPPRTPRGVLSYQVAYDGLTTRCAPSYEILWGAMVEHVLVNKALRRGWIVVLPDYEGPDAEFLAGANAGRGVLDGLRAARAFLPDPLFDARTPIALWGYSGGAFASLWAAELAAEHAPELSIAAVAAGGPPADLLASAERVDGGLFAGLYFAAVVGLARAHPEIDVDALLNERGREMFAEVGDSCVGQELAWVRDPVLSGYAFDQVADYFTVDEPLAVPALARVARANTLGQRGFDAPLLYYQALFDQVSARADARALAARYCALGVPVRFDTAIGEHITAAITHASTAVAYLDDRAAGRPPPNDCAALSPP